MAGGRRKKRSQFKRDANLSGHKSRLRPSELGMLDAQSIRDVSSQFVTSTHTIQEDSVVFPRAAKEHASEWSVHGVRVAPENVAQLIRVMCQRAPRDVRWLGTAAKGETAIRRVIKETAGTAQIFNFDTAITRQARLLSVDFVPLMGKLMDRLRLPFQSILMTYPVKSAFGGEMTDVDLCVDLVYQASEGVIRVVPLSIMADKDDNRPMLVLPPYSYTITLEERRHNVSQFDLVCGSMVLGMAHLEKKSLEDVLKEMRRFGAEEYGVYGWLCHMLGETANYLYDANLRDSLPSVVNHFNITAPPWGPMEYTNQQQQIVGPLLTETNGHLRMVAALLLMLNLKDNVTGVIRNRQNKKFRFHSKDHPYFVEHSVMLKLPEPKVRRALQDEHDVHFPTGIHHKRHPVRGHWCQRGGLDICPHEWVSLDINHSECILCERQSYFRKAHERGDASLGYVVHKSYEVEHRGHSRKGRKGRHQV